MTRSLLLLAAALGSLEGCAARTALWAYTGDAAEVASFLRENPEHIDDRFDEKVCTGCTLLEFATLGHSIDVTELLVERGADVNAVDRGGETALHMACRTQDVYLARFLLSHGAQRSVQVRDAAGNTPLIDAAAAEGTRSVPVPVMGEVVITTLEAPPSAELVQLLLDAGADLSAPTNRGNTALHIAAYKGHLEIVRLLLSRGADRNLKNARGETAEMLADRFHQAEVVKALREPPAR